MQPALERQARLYRETGANIPLAGDAKTVLSSFKQWATRK
jgi:hypothetical protein